MEEGGVYMDGGIVTDGRELNRNRQAGRQTDRQTDRHTVIPRHGNEESVVIQQHLCVVNRTTGNNLYYIGARHGNSPRCTTVQKLAQQC